MFATRLLLSAALLAAPPAFAQVSSLCGTGPGALPEAALAVAPRLLVRGEGNLRWFGLLAYSARLLAPDGRWQADEPYALEIRYARHFTADQLAGRSIDEMRHIGAGTEAKYERWRAAMKKTFPDVVDGDCLLGVSAPGAPSRFFLNGKPLPPIEDPEFGPAFFGIWLSPATSQPRLRRQLLGEK